MDNIRFLLQLETVQRAECFQRKTKNDLLNQHFVDEQSWETERKRSVWSHERARVCVFVWAHGQTREEKAMIQSHMTAAVT